MVCPNCGFEWSVDFCESEFDDGSREWFEHCLSCDHEWRVFQAAEHLAHDVVSVIFNDEDIPF